MTFGLAGGARIVGTSFSVGKTTLTQSRLRDKTLDAVCTYRPASDGVLRCLPSSFDFVKYFGRQVFGDAACTVALATGPDTCDAGKWISVASDACPTLWTVRELKSRVATATLDVHVKEGTVCRKLGASDEPPPGFVWIVGDPVVPTTFVEGKTKEL